MELFVIIAPPGGGKTTVYYFLKKFFKKEFRKELLYVGTGDIFRSLTKKINYLTLLFFRLFNLPFVHESHKENIRERMLDQKLVSNIWADHLIFEALTSKKRDSSLFLDGHPRDIEQAMFFLCLIKEVGVTRIILINLFVDRKIAIERMVSRKREKGADVLSLLEKYAQRYDEFCTKTNPVFSYLSLELQKLDQIKTGYVLFNDDGSLFPEDVARNIFEKIKKILS